MENSGFLDGILWWRPGRGARGGKGGLTAPAASLC